MRARDQFDAFQSNAADRGPELSSHGTEVTWRTTISTLAVTPSQRRSHWHEAFCRNVLDVECLSRVGGNFGASFDIRHLNETKLIKASTDPVSIARTRRVISRSGSDMLTLVIGISGRAGVEHRDHLGILEPDSFVLLDEARPNRFITMPGQEESGPEVSPASFRSLVAIMPRAEIERRIGDFNLIAGLCTQADPTLGQITVSFLYTLQKSGALPAPELEASLEAQAMDLISMNLSVILGRQPHQSAYRCSLMHRMKFYIRQNLHDTNLSTVSIANAFRLSPRSIQSLFAEFGESPGKYVRTQRLKLARRMLEMPHRGAKSIEAIALETGFGSHSHFCRSFKEAYGCSPSEFCRLSLKCQSDH